MVCKKLTQCNCLINIGNDGQSTIKQHVITVKHERYKFSTTSKEDDKIRLLLRRMWVKKIFKNQRRSCSGLPHWTVSSVLQLTMLLTACVSMRNVQWTKESNKLDETTLETMKQTKWNIEDNYKEFYKQILQNKEKLRRSKLPGKYT